MNIFLSPHDDDNVLFGAFTCIREHPIVVVVTDSFIQPARGEVGCSAKERSDETEAACGILGCPVRRLGIPDNIVNKEKIKEELFGLIIDLVQSNDFSRFDRVYAPEIVEGGNIHHNMLGEAAEEVFGKQVIFYTTYKKDQLYMKGNIEVVPTEKELDLKREALKCYQSQIGINFPHFFAVKDKSEWLL